MELKIRMANHADGQEISRLMKADGFLFDGFEFDWSEIYPYWLVAEIAGEIIGCIQVCPSKPIGRLEMLCIDEKLSKKERAITARELPKHGCATLRVYGCQAASSVISDLDQSWKTVVRHRGWVEIDHGSLMLKRFTA